MGSQEVIRVPVGGTTYSQEGFRISVIKPVSDHAIPGETPLHEATHAVVAERNKTASVVKTTVIPGSGYEGLTELTGYDSVAAVAPHAMGFDGTGHDISIVTFMGDDTLSAGTIAQGIVSDNKEHIDAVAQRLQEEKTLSGVEVRDTIDEVDKGPEVIVYIKNPDGEEKQMKGLRAKEPTVLIPGDWLLLDAA